MRVFDRGTRQVAPRIELIEFYNIKRVERGINWRKPLRQKGGVDGVVARHTYVEQKGEGSRGRDNPNVPNIDALLSIGQG